MKFLQRLEKTKANSILVPSAAKPSKGSHGAVGFGFSGAEHSFPRFLIMSTTIVLQMVSLLLPSIIDHNVDYPSLDFGEH
jgi:hypothetical protein